MRGVANVICGITFGEGRDTTNPDLDRLLKLNMKIIANADVTRFVRILDFFSWAHYLPIKAYDQVLQPFFDIHDLIRQIFSQRESKFDPGEPVKDLISGLLHAKLEAERDSEGRAVLLSDDYFVMTIEDMFFAGYETTSTTLKWFIAFVANCQKYQEDIQHQLDEVVGERSPSLDDRPNLPLIQAAIIETLRVGNLVPFAVPHITLTDTTLCGYRVPKDTIVFANTESVHLDPKCWENPTVLTHTVILTRMASWSPTKATSILLELDAGFALESRWLKLSCSCLSRGCFKSLLWSVKMVIHLKQRAL
ncbi:hypothetical protein OS493_019176 [Desmophyllum pertusum]|uniref:Cytochrome P450 n=1 Tax=Desmophyllum pertusum TaxID=174260 RepID=A0A9W9YD88_9CNID|nr:hypothetical protein OS493_019176 [Desmophyllum pertusum]